MYQVMAQTDKPGVYAKHGEPKPLSTNIGQIALVVRNLRKKGRFAYIKNTVTGQGVKIGATGKKR